MAATSEQGVIALLTAGVCIFGFIFNSIMLIVLRRLPELKNAFGYMCTSHIIADFGVLFCFLFWGVPMALTNNEALSQSNIGKVVGGISVLFWQTSVYSHVFVALNRFCAIYMPYRYLTFYQKSTTFKFIALSWILAFCHTLPFFFDGCGFHYTTKGYLWLFDNTPCSQWIAKFIDFYLNAIWMFVIAVFDALNVIRIIGMWGKLSVATATTSSQRKRREIIFFIQAFIQNILFALLTFCFHWAEIWATDTVSLFLFTTFFWGILHAVDGLILLAFNLGMDRRKIFNVLCKNTTAVYASSTNEQTRIASLPTQNWSNHQVVPTIDSAWQTENN